MWGTIGSGLTSRAKKHWWQPGFPALITVGGVDRFLEVLSHTAKDPLSAGSSKHDFDTAVRVYMMIEAYHEVIMSQLLIIRV